MVRDIEDIVTNVNFVLRLAECIVCLIGLMLLFADISCFWASYFWLVHGWFLISLAFIGIYIFERPNYGMEIITVIVYNYHIGQALSKEYSNDNLCPFITAILLYVDFFYLVVNRPKRRNTS